MTAPQKSENRNDAGEERDADEEVEPGAGARSCVLEHAQIDDRVVRLQLVHDEGDERR